MEITSRQTIPPKETYKAYLLREESIEFLYQNRINKHTEEVNLNNNVSQDWENLKSVIHKTAAETLGKEEKQ
jgi:hypothetical protein